MHVFWIDEAVYALADRYKADCLVGDGSLLTAGSAIHSLENLEALLGVIEPADHSKGQFIPKLIVQVSGLSDSAVQLAAEMVAFQLLGEGDTGGAKKIEHVEALLGQMSAPVALSAPLRDALSGGGVSSYSAGKNYRDVYLRFLVRVARRVKELGPDDRAKLLSDPWRFRDFIQQDRSSGNGMQANVLLHLMFPETFSTVAAASNRAALLRTFADAPGLTDQAEEDRKLLRLQELVDEQTGYEISFYDPPLRDIWDGDPDEHVQELIEWACRLYAHSSFDEQEYDYKQPLIEALAPVPEALTGSGDWLGLLRAALTHKDNNLTAWQVNAKFLDWCAASPDDVVAALESLWGAGGWDEALAGFVDVVPDEVAGGVGGLLSLASYLLLAVEPQHTPPFRWTVYEKLLAILNRTPPPATDPKNERSHAVRVWEEWVTTIEEIQLRMLTRGVALRGALDAQGLVYWIVSSDPPSDWDEDSRLAFARFRGNIDPAPAPTTVEVGAAEVPALRPATPELADALHLPLLWLQETVELLAEKRQLIFYGPPGTGKTYIAKHLAGHIADDEAVRLIQLHPSYTYEDFFEGYRPISTEGQLSYTLARGPLRLLADQARKNPEIPQLCCLWTRSTAATSPRYSASCTSCSSIARRLSRCSTRPGSSSRCRATFT